MREYLKMRFLELKGLKIEQITKRQKEILEKEKPNIWDFYTWNI